MYLVASGILRRGVNVFDRLKQTGLQSSFVELYDVYETLNRM